MEKQPPIHASAVPASGEPPSVTPMSAHPGRRSIATRWGERIGHASATFGSATSRIATSEHAHQPLDEIRAIRVARLRLLGTAASMLMAFGAVGAGALPVLQNPAQGERVVGFLLRVQQGSMTIAMIGMVALTLCWLALGYYALGRSFRGRPLPTLRRLELDRIIATWAIPLAVAPPMFSKDVYSYLAHGAMAEVLGDPYSLGPVAALGVDHPLTINVPTMWRETANQYGPAFLAIERFVFEITGDNVVAGLAIHRIFAVLGIIAMAWAIPRLARRCGVSDVAALWLGVGNPLVLFHLVSGIHSESVMLGFLGVGLVAVLRATDHLGPWGTREYALFVAGTVLVTAAAMVKLPVAVALGFVGIALARRLGTSWGAFLRAVGVMAVLSIATTLIAMAVTDSGFGWLTKLGAATAVRSWLSLPTAFGVIVGAVGQILGLGDHTEQVLAITQTGGMLVAGLWTLWLLWVVWKGHLHPLGGMGLALLGIVLMFPVVQPWYALWAMVPLAAWVSAWRFRLLVIAYSALLACFVLPPGYGPPPAVTIGAWVATVIVLAIGILLCAWRPGYLRLDRIAQGGGSARAREDIPSTA